MPHHLSFVCASTGLGIMLALGGCEQTGTNETATTPAVEVTPASAKVLNFKVTGMHCGGCANGLKSKLAKLEGVTACDASFENSSATVTANDPKVAAEVLAAVTEMGYTGELVDDAGAAQN